MVDTVFVPGDQGALVLFDQHSDQSRAFDLLRAQAVLAQKARQVSGGIEHVTVLIGAVHVALSQAAEQGQ